jgi:hypothetical protein
VAASKDIYVTVGSDVGRHREVYIDILVGKDDDVAATASMRPVLSGWSSSLRDISTLLSDGCWSASRGLLTFCREKTTSAAINSASYAVLRCQVVASQDVYVAGRPMTESPTNFLTGKDDDVDAINSALDVRPKGAKILRGFTRPLR